MGPVDSAAFDSTPFPFPMAISPRRSTAAAPQVRPVAVSIGSLVRKVADLTQPGRFRTIAPHTRPLERNKE